MYKSLMILFNLTIGNTMPIALKRLKVWIGSATLILVSALLYFAWEKERYHETTDDAYVLGNKVLISSQISGRITAIYTEDTHFVEKNAPLVQLDPTDAQVAFEKSQAELAHHIRQVRGMFAKVQELEAVQRQRKSLYLQAEKEYCRRQQLIESGAISQEELEKAYSHYESTAAALKEGEHQLDSARAQVEGVDLYSHPLVQSSIQKTKEAWLTLKRCSIVAPISGVLTQKKVHVGDWVSPGYPLFTLIPLDEVWVEANFKEKQLAHLRVGQPVIMRADVYGKKITYQGRVIGLEAGTGSAFSLLPPQNATGNWIKIVQRVPVRISLDKNTLQKHPLRLGLSMWVCVDTKNCDIPIEIPPPPSLLYSTDVFTHLADKDEWENILSKIFEENGGLAFPNEDR